MLDLDEQLTVFGRWLDHEIAAVMAERRSSSVPTSAPVAATASGSRNGSVARARGLSRREREDRRHRLGTLVLAGAVAAAAALTILVAVSHSDSPTQPLYPARTTTTSNDATSPTTTAASASRAVESTASTSAATTPPTLGEEPATSSTIGPTSDRRVTTTGTPSAPRPAVASSAPATASTPEAASTTSVAPASSAAPPVTTAPPVVTGTTGPGCMNDVRRVGAAGTIFYRACGDGIHLIGVTAVADWSVGVTAGGPPVVAVRFVLATGSVLSCTISGTSDGVTFAGDC